MANQQRSMQKMWNWNYWRRKCFWINRRELETELDYDNWTQIFDKFDPKKQKYRQELISNAKSQQCRLFVRKDLLQRKIKSCRKALEKFLTFKKS